MSLPFTDSSEGIMRRLSAADTVSSADRRAEILNALRAEYPIDRPPSRTVMDSALDADPSASASSLDLPSMMAGPDRIRRRSELSRIRTPAPAEAIELSTLSPIDEQNHGQSSAIQTMIAGLAGEPPLEKMVDVETAPTSYAPSLHYAGSEGQSSAAPNPPISPAQRAKYRLNSRIQFAALCYSFFLEGWNDGSTGPLLPRIQRNYGVSMSGSRRCMYLALTRRADRLCPGVAALRDKLRGMKSLPCTHVPVHV